MLPQPQKENKKFQKLCFIISCCKVPELAGYIAKSGPIIRDAYEILYKEAYFSTLHDYVFCNVLVAGIFIYVCFQFKIIAVS